MAKLITIYAFTDKYTFNGLTIVVKSELHNHHTFCFCFACFSVHCLAFLRKTGLLYLNSEDCDKIIEESMERRMICSG